MGKNDGQIALDMEGDAELEGGGFTGLERCRKRNLGNYRVFQGMEHCWFFSV